MELKDWCKYLPYEVMVQGKDYGDSLITKTLKEYPSSYGTTWVSLEYAMSRKLNPVLRPLSQLTEEIKVNGKRFVPIVELLEMRYDYWFKSNLDAEYRKADVSITPSTITACSIIHKADYTITIHLNRLEDMPYWVIEKLHEWHFDTGKYIEKGEAVEMY